MKRFKKTENSQKVSRKKSTMTWYELKKIKEREAEETASIWMNDLLNKFDTIVDGKFSEKSSCSDLLEMERNELISEKEEEPKLSKWKRWIEIREKESKRIARATQRCPRELLLNANPNCFRAVLKHKEIDEKSKNNAGDLNFWRMPEKIRNGLFFTLPKSDQSRSPPEIVYTQTPDTILIEQKINIAKSGINGLQKILKLISDRSIANVKFLPKLENMVIEGNPKDMAHKRCIDSSDSKEIQFSSSSNNSLWQNEKRQVLVVNEIVLDMNSKFFVDLTFSGFKYEHHTNYLKLKNTGDIAINVSYEPQKNSYELDGTSSNVFFFDKCPFRIVPGETIEIPFYFYSERSGLFSERWILKFDPPLHCEHPTVVCLHATCAIKHKNNCQRLKKLTDEIFTKSAYNCVENEIDDILTIAVPICKSVHHLEQEDKFEKANSTLKYHPGAIETMTEIYNEINESEFEWNLNATDLYKMILTVYDNDEKLQNAYHRFNDALKKMMDKKSIAKWNDTDEMRMIKLSMIKNCFAVFFEKFEEAENSCNQFCFIKNHFITVINKLINILECYIFMH